MEIDSLRIKKTVVNTYYFNTCIPLCYSLLVCQWKRDIEKAMNLLKQAVTLDQKCDFAYETLATLQVQR